MFYVISIAVLLFSVSLHEAAHGWMAEKFGDPTARYQGRITLNPIKHIDPIGSVILPVILVVVHSPFVFGWAKPVLVDPYALRNRRKAWLYIAAAGPLSNLLLATISVILFKVFFPPQYLLLNGQALHSSLPFIILLTAIQLNVILAVFNLMPIPPLDGSKILESQLRGQALRTFEKIQPYGPIIFLLVIMTHLFDYIARPVINLVYRIILF